MIGRHRFRDRRVQRTTRHRDVEVVDARTLTAHFLTMEALAGAPRAATWPSAATTCCLPVSPRLDGAVARPVS